MRIAIIGAGNVGGTLGEGWRARGHEVVYGVRAGAAGRGPGGARATSPREAATGAEVAVLATPWPAAAAVVRELGDLGGRVLIDATNPIGPGFELAVGRTTSGAETLQEVAHNARVVKAFNSVGFEVMREARFPGGPAAMLIAGDDATATETAAQLARDLGFDALALAGLALARALEPLAMLWITLSRQAGWDRGFALGARRHATAEPLPGRRTTDARTIVVFGAGNIGGNLARAWLRAGHRVHVATRNPDDAAVRALAAAGAIPVPAAGAAEPADVVVLAVPAAIAGDVAAQAGSLAGKVVIDCTNAIGKGAVLEHGLTTSTAEQLQARSPGAHLIKAFNQQGAETLAAPLFGGLPAVSFVAGDQPAARAVTAALVEDVGLRPVDAGPLRMARYLEPLTIAWIAASRSLGTRDFGFVLLERGRG